jgi:hypothetical protein
MKINSSVVGLSDIERLFVSIRACGVEPPPVLLSVLQARERIAAAPEPVDPLRQLVEAALGGDDVSLDEVLREHAINTLVANSRNGLLQRTEAALLAEFGRRLESGGADDVLDSVRPAFGKAADALRAAIDTISSYPTNIEAFVNSASAKQLHAFQSIGSLIRVLDRAAGVAAYFGPVGPFPVVEDPRQIAPVLQIGWLRSVAVMATDGDVMHACLEHGEPHPHGSIATSPWLRTVPYLHTVDSARERLRAWAESAWAADESGRPRGGKLINGNIVHDPPRANPFAEVSA